MTYIDFDARITPPPPGKEISFKLGGTVFRCTNPLPIGAVVPLANASAKAARKDIHPDEKAVATAALVGALDGVLRAWVVPEQHEEWDRVLRGLADLTVLNQIVEYIVGAVGGSDDDANPGGVSSLAAPNRSTRRARPAA